MRDYRDAKAMAQSLRQALTERTVTVTHSDALELVSKAFGFDNWNILAAKIEAAETPALAEAAELKTLYCSFCGKSQHEVTKLIAGPASFICNECVALCTSIVQEDDIGQLIARDRAAPGGGDFPALTEFMRGRSREELAAQTASTRRMVEHDRWSLRALRTVLGEPVAPDPAADAFAASLRLKGDPLAGKTREQMLAQKTDLERRLEMHELALQVAATVLAERPESEAPGAPA